MRYKNLRWVRNRAVYAVLAAVVALAVGAAPAVSTAVNNIWAENAAAQAQTAEQGLQQATVKRVIDGDTLLVAVSGEEQRVRLIGIDTPESVHPDESKNTQEGKDASEHTKSLLPAGTAVWLEADAEDQDKYGRSLRYVWLEAPTDSDSESEAKAKMLNAQLVADGWAEPLTIKPNTKWEALFASLANGR